MWNRVHEEGYTDVRSEKVVFKRMENPKNSRKRRENVTAEKLLIVATTTEKLLNLTKCYRYQFDL